MDEVNIIITNITNLENAVVKAKRYNAVKMEMALMNINSARKELKKALEEKQIAEDLKKMLSDANAEGLSPFICSAYRSVERQESLFDSGFQKRVNSGLGYYEAYLKTASVIAVPGTSEHALGLAVDIVANDYTNLDEGQEETDEFKWLSANCHKYGFILRYPNGTTDITGIIYEPWHFRYVGVEVATEIAELGVTLEEYLANHYNK